MVNNDLRRHTHSGPGDGGEIPVPNEIGSGTLSATAGGDAQTTIDAPRDPGVRFNVVPDENYSGTLTESANTAGVVADSEWSVMYDGSQGAWVLGINEGTGSESLTAEYTVYKL